MRKLKNVIFLISINLMVIFCFLAFATCVIALLPEIAKASIDMFGSTLSAPCPTVH